MQKKLKLSSRYWDPLDMSVVFGCMLIIGALLCFGPLVRSVVSSEFAEKNQDEAWITQDLLSTRHSDSTLNERLRNDNLSVYVQICRVFPSREELAASRRMRRTFGNQKISNTFCPFFVRVGDNDVVCFGSTGIMSGNQVGPQVGLQASKYYLWLESQEFW